MPSTVMVWAEDEDRSGADTNLSSVANERFFITDGDNMRFRKDMPFVAMAYNWTESASYNVVQTFAESPTTNASPLYWTNGFAGTFKEHLNVNDYRTNPLTVFRAGDNIKIKGHEHDQGGTAHVLATCLIVSNGQIPVGQPPMAITHQPKWTGSASTQVIGSGWKQISMTEETGKELTSGKYLMHGASVCSPTVIACRFIFKGTELPMPVIPRNTENDPVHPFSRYWGKSMEFTYPDNLPTIEILTQASETIDSIVPFLTKVN